MKSLIQKIGRKIFREIRKVYQRPVSIKQSIFINTIPKSGTNLIKRIVLLLLNRENFIYFDEIGFSKEEIKEILKENHENKIIIAHLSYNSEIASLLEGKYKVILLLRDPRDITVSHFHYVTNNKEIDGLERQTNYYYRNLSSDEERLKTSVLGKKEIGQKSIKEVLTDYLKWFNLKEYCLVRFENLIGSKGRGKKENQLKEISKITEFLKIDVPFQKIEKVANLAFNPKSGKFRKGQIGDWKNYFNQSHKKIFKEIAGQYFINLGYEKDFNW